MKTIYQCLTAAMLLAASCKPPHVASGFAICLCHNDSTTKTYNISNTYSQADSVKYADSCRSLQALYTGDTCMAQREAL